jgi:hypothetical protein
MILTAERLLMEASRRHFIARIRRVAGLWFWVDQAPRSFQASTILGQWRAG